jgi:protoheme IX farnesyltransferase
MAKVVGVGPAVVSADRRFLRRLHAFVVLMKLRIIELLLITTLPVMFVAAKTVPSPKLVLCTLVAGTLSAAGANVGNMVYDKDIDALMKRTKSRPLVTGAVSTREAIVFACALEVTAFVIFATTVNVLSGVLSIGAALFYLLIYTMWLKRRSVSNIVIGGAAGALPPVIGWTAVTDHLAIAPVICFAIVFVWTPPHFWALATKYREDYAAASVPMLPVVADETKVNRQILVYTVVVVALSFLLAPFAHLGVLYLVVASIAGVEFLWRAIALQRSPGTKAAMRVFGSSIRYLSLVFLAMGLDAILRHP